MKNGNDDRRKKEERLTPFKQYLENYCANSVIWGNFALEGTDNFLDLLKSLGIYALCFALNVEQIRRFLNEIEKELNTLNLEKIRLCGDGVFKTSLPEWFFREMIKKEERLWQYPPLGWTAKTPADLFLLLKEEEEEGKKEPTRITDLGKYRVIRKEHEVDYGIKKLRVREILDKSIARIETVATDKVALFSQTMLCFGMIRFSLEKEPELITKIE